MLISEISTRVVDAGDRDWVFIRVDTDEPGLFGWGEASLGWYPSAVCGAVRDLSSLAHRGGPASDRAALANDDSCPVLPRRDRGHERDRRDRPSPVGHQGQGARRSALPTPGGTGPRSRAHVREPGLGARRRTARARSVVRRGAPRPGRRVRCHEGVPGATGPAAGGVGVPPSDGGSGRRRPGGGGRRGRHHGGPARANHAGGGDPGGTRDRAAAALVPGGALPAGQRRRDGRGRAGAPDPHRDRRAARHATRVPGGPGEASVCRHPTERLLLRRGLRVPADRGDGGDLPGLRGAAQPERADRSDGQRPPRARGARTS